MKSNTMCFDIATRDRVAFIQSRWHREIVDRLRDSFLDAFAMLDGRQVDVFEVPGAFEIPLKAQFLANTGQYAAIVAAGLVVDGGIYRHEFVASAVIDGLMRTQLATHTPIFDCGLRTGTGLARRVTESGWLWLSGDHYYMYMAHPLSPPIVSCLTIHNDIL